MAANVRKLDSAPRKVHKGLNLDSLDYSGPPDYEFTLGGREYVLTSAARLDVRTLTDMQRDVMLFLSQAMSAEDYAALSEQRLEAWQLKTLAEDYVEVSGLGN